MNVRPQPPTTNGPPGKGVALAPAWQMALEANFGSVERWHDGFAALSKSVVEHRSGRVVLSFQPHSGTLVNQWEDDHAPVSSGGVPLLSLAVDRNACHVDDGARAAGVDAFIAAIDWAGVYARYQCAVDAASEPHGARQDEIEGAVLLDVRRAGAYSQAESVIEGARWCDPSKVNGWAGELPADRAVVVYCVYGHEVGRATALRLRDAGLNARFLRGGIDAWQAAGRPLARKVAG